MKWGFLSHSSYPTTGIIVHQRFKSISQKFSFSISLNKHNGESSQVYKTIHPGKSHECYTLLSNFGSDIELTYVYLWLFHEIYSVELSLPSFWQVQVANYIQCSSIWFSLYDCICEKNPAKATGISVWTYNMHYEKID